MSRWLSLVLILFANLAHSADYVIAISVDALGSQYLQALIQADQLPHFKQLEMEAAYTLNARNDFDITVTLPNHTSMITSRPILGPVGHNWVKNTDPAADMTLHSHRGAYVTGVFDVAHDHGLRTGLWATKTKFSLFRISYDAGHGAPDTTGENNGPNKLDVFVYEQSSPALTCNFITTMSTQPCQASLIHFTEPDSAGHTSGWGNEAYNNALITIDTCLGQIMDLIATHSLLKGKTTLIVTADHGGKGQNHNDADEPLNYTIPFLVWGAGVTPGDLYDWNTGVRQNPGTNHPAYTNPLQPIRNSEVGNLMLSLLNLGPIPGSAINTRQDLRITRSTPADPVQAH
jgi:predicted AlkP superfamily pyrophosphatase or phosphodiesterase